MSSSQTNSQTRTRRWGVFSLATAGFCISCYVLGGLVVAELSLSYFGTDLQTKARLRSWLNPYLAIIMILNITGILAGAHAIKRRELYLAPAIVGIVLNSIPLLIGAASAIYG